MEADFSGWATKAGLKCTDGRTIMPDAFKHQDKVTVPLVWQHGHNDVKNILGHVVLQHRAEGVYGYGYFNGTDQGKSAKQLVVHKDIKALSIYANKLVEQNKSVLHGDIKEVSLVLSGANPGAEIDFVAVQHSDGDIETLSDEAVIYTGLELEHEDKPADPAPAPASDPAPAGDKTVQDVYNTLSQEQKDVVDFMIGKAVEQVDSGDAEHSDEAPKQDDKPEGDLNHQEGNQDMSRNVFDQTGTNAGPGTQRKHLTHAQIDTIVTDAKKLGSFKEAVLAHAVEYGIENIDFLFPDAKTIDSTPEMISRRMEWVQTVIGGARKTPFSRIKTMSADITHDEARAKGYVKGNLKKEEWFALAKRVTTPTTIYKKQKLDRDDIVDITDMDVVAWLKAEMRVMLDEELARAALVGDGREPDDEDKINESNIRPIAFEDDFYAEKLVVPANVVGDAFVEAILRVRPKYRGSGNPTMFITEDALTDLLLVKDKMGRRLYPTPTDLATACRVSNIVTVPVMESVSTTGGDLLAILVNMSDYTFGADRGGAVSMFDDFDIDYNQYKYLIETRCSGALIRFKTAIVISRATGATLVTPTVPTFVPATGVVTIPNVAGVIYQNEDTDAVLTAGPQPALAPGARLSVIAVPAANNYFAHNTDTDWDFDRPSA